MRKFIVGKPGSLKLVAGHNPPPGALCEAPEHFTREMEPYFKLISIPQQQTGFSHSVEVDPLFKQKLAESLLIVDKGQSEQVKFNLLKPHQRFAYNILGKRYKKLGEL